MPIFDRELVPIAVVDEMKQAYMDYAMSVIVSRALPDARDGFKPVHRRILYTMREENLTPDRPFKKSASTVGNVLARYHPHGDAPVYDSMVRMAQDFNMRYPLVQGHGNFGSIDGDNPAAMRYTEARLARIAMMMLEDLDKDTVDWRPNFDASLLEPVVLPSRLPNLLLNGTDGIAVGMATKIPPHNLGELIDGVLALLDNPETSVEDLIAIIPGPDLPTGAKILGNSGIKEAYRSGRGSVLMRANIEVEDLGRDRHSLIVTAIPFQVNKTRLLERIGDSIRDKRIEGVSAFRDESDRKGMRIVLELSSNTHPEVVMNQLYKHSELQTSFGINMLALVDGVPKVLNLRELLMVFIKHRRDVVRRRSQYLLDKALKRAHILEGLLKALDHIDEIIKLIRGSADPESARSGLITKFEFSDVQAQAILDMRLQRLTGLERDRLESEHREVMANIEYLRGLLDDPVKLDAVVREELVEVRHLFSDPRRTEIIAGAGGDLNIEDLIADEKMVVTISHSGYIKRVPFDTYRTQKRGGRGVSGTDLKDEDFLEHLFVSNTHEYLLFFTNTARVFKKKVHEILEFSRTARGSALVNLLNFGPGEKVAAVIPVRKFDQGGAVVTCTKSGIVKRTELDLYSNISAGGIIALNLRDGDELVSVKLSPGHEDLIIVTRHGQAVRFNVTDVRSMGRTATGVKGVTLREGDHVIAMETTDSGSELLVVTESGYGKRTPLDQYPVINRGGVGVKTIQMTDRNGSIMGALVVTEDHELMVSTMQGTVIKMAVKDISVFGRATQGVRVIRLGEGDTVGAVTRIIPEDESDENGEIEEGATDEESPIESESDNSEDE